MLSLHHIHGEPPQERVLHTKSVEGASWKLRKGMQSSGEKMPRGSPELTTSQSKTSWGHQPHCYLQPVLGYWPGNDSRGQEERAPPHPWECSELLFLHLPARAVLAFPGILGNCLAPLLLQAQITAEHCRALLPLPALPRAPLELRDQGLLLREMTPHTPVPAPHHLGVWLRHWGHWWDWDVPSRLWHLR